MEEPEAGTIADAYHPEVRENLREWVVKALEAEPGARTGIQTVGLDVRLFPFNDLTNPPENRQLIPVAPAVESVGDLTLPLEQWSPNSKYELHPSRETIQIDVEKPASGTVTLQLSTDALLSLNPSEHPIPNAHVMKLGDALREAADKDLGMQHIRARRKSARERRTDLESRAKEVLSLAREVLFAWTIVSLEGEEHEEVPPADGLRPWFPAVPTGASRKTEPEYREQWTEAKQRNALMRDYSPSGLFVREVRHLWDLIVRRQLGEHHMRATAEPLDVPDSLTAAAAFALEALHEELQTLDEKIASCQAEALAWRAMETYGEDISEQRDELRKILTDDSRRLQWIGNELLPNGGETWRERQETLEELCDNLGITCPYEDHDNLRRSFNKSRWGG